MRRTTSALLAISAAVVVEAAAVRHLGGQSASNPPGARLKLPVGSVTPAIALARSHGVVLASNGSLWSWGENDFGWPVLGLDNIKTQVCLRRIGDENDWSSLAVGGGALHRLAIKFNGTLWSCGQNEVGQLSDGTNGRHKMQSTPAA